MNASQTSLVDQLQNEITSLKQKNSLLQEQLDWFRRQIFGKRSEKVVANLDDQYLRLLPGFDHIKTPEPVTKTIASHQRKNPTRHGKDSVQLPDDLPVERTVIDLPESEKTCSETGKPLVRIGEEISRKLAQKPGCYYIKEIVRLKYALPKESGEGIRCPDLPDSLLPRCQADESFLAELLVKKFADHNPLYRYEEQLSREKIRIPRQVLSQWVLKAGEALSPLYRKMKQIILESRNIFIDESPVSLLSPGKGKTQKAYMWVVVGGTSTDPPYRIYNFRENRQHIHAIELLTDYRGVLHSDKYGAYETLAGNKEIVWCPCWSHIRRKFLEAEAGDKKLREWVLCQIRYLFMLERVAWAREPEVRLRIRQEKEVPIIDELIDVIKGRLIHGKILPKSKLRTALGYFCSLIPHLKNYTERPYARIDNNVAERAIRPLAIGRKNWMFVGSHKGGEAAATILSLIQTCRGLGINPREYLEDVMRRLMSHSSQRLHELLPDHWAAAQQQPTAKLT